MNTGKLLRKYSFLIIAFFLFISAGEIQDQNTRKYLVYKYNIDDQIARPMWRITQKSFAEAAKLKADIILIQMNTYGGLVDIADSIRTKILNSPIPVYIFIDDNAASAGALISIACDSIYMRAGGKIGAATVVNQTGEVVPDKFQSYMRATMRATAEAHGKDTLIQGNDTIISWKRNPLIAEAMVDPSLYVAGISDSGKVLTFTAEEAVNAGYCEGIVSNAADIMKKAGIKNYEIVEFKPTSLDKFINFLLNPIVHSLLIMLIIGGIYFELQTPGIGFPLAAALLGAVLYFAPLYLEGMAENWEILVFILGVILLAVEIFAIPGFGVAGIAGIILMVSGLTLAMVDNLVFEGGSIAEAINAVMRALMIVVLSVFAAVIASLYLGKKLITSPAFPGIALQETQKKEEGFTSADPLQQKLIGSEGVAYTVLRPSGKVEVLGDIYDAKSEFGFIEKGSKIVVTRYETGQLYVEKI
ncbi:MAG: nodulation protein NfeD [Bacteroidales bacterium]|nr:nodulation protein NfeD [Bacteroidales bacterium]MCB9013669.1 nodulation protein NfeD [Bacteroidales bacterium]